MPIVSVRMRICVRLPILHINIDKASLFDIFPVKAVILEMILIQDKMVNKAFFKHSFLVKQRCGVI